MDGVSTTLGLVPRRAAALVTEALADTRVVAISGPRQCGKSTLAAVISAAHPGTVHRSLDELDMRDLAGSDPRTFVEHEGLMVIDEVQRVPDLLLAIKARVDRDPRPCQFLLTGSSDLRSSARLRDSLPGRMEIVDLWPFSQGEIDGQPDGLLDAAIGGRLGRAPTFVGDPTPRSDLLELVARGGYPQAIARTQQRRRSAFHRAWVDSVVRRDAGDILHATRPDELARLIELMAANTAGHVVVDRLARDLKISASTVRRYLMVLEQTFTICTVPSWHSGLTSRAVKMRKAAFVDTGVAATVLRADVRALAEPGALLAGPLVETFAIMELVKQASWSPHAPALYHFRTRDGIEIDLVADVAGRVIVGFEVKSGATVRNTDFRGLRHLRDRLGDRFRAGIVLHAGPTAAAWGDRLWALPLDALWRTPVPEE